MAKSGKTRYRDNSIKADQHTNLLQTSFSITHEKSYVGGCIQNYHPYLAFLFSLFCYPNISNAFPFACLCHHLESCQQTASPLSGVEQWGQSPHDVEGAESSIAINVTIIQSSSVQFTPTVIDGLSCDHDYESKNGVQNEATVLSGGFQAYCENLKLGKSDGFMHCPCKMLLFCVNTIEIDLGNFPSEKKLEQHFGCLVTF